MAHYDPACNWCDSYNYHATRSDCDREKRQKQEADAARAKLDAEAKTFLRAYGFTLGDNYTNVRFYEHLKKLQADGVVTFKEPTLLHLVSSSAPGKTLCGKIALNGSLSYIQEGLHNNSKTNCQACYEKAPVYDAWDGW